MTGDMPQSRNYPPTPALSAYIARHYVFSIDASADLMMIDHLLAETAFARLLLRGDWGAETSPGEWTNIGPAVFFGPNSRPMRVRVRGGFRVVGIAFCPAGWRALSETPVDRFTDRMVPLSEVLGPRAQALLSDVVAVDREDEQGDAAIIAAIEHHIAALLDERGRGEPEAAMQRFEEIARNESTTLVRDAAAALGLTQRQLERRCLASFGMSPKAVLRRSRFLDMAAAMRGLSHPGDLEVAALRFYDQPQLIREFRHFITMTPRQFTKTPTPLLTAGLELRNSRKAQDAARRREAQRA